MRNALASRGRISSAARVVRSLGRLILVASLVGLSPFSSREASWNFETEEPGQAAEGFTNDVGRWEVVNADGNLVLAQRAENRLSVFNLTLVEQSSYRDVDLSVRIKSVGGENERGGGLVWRAKDKDNYYLVRYNPHSARHSPRRPNFRLYKIENGKLTQLDHADVPGDSDWHTIRITTCGTQIVGYLDEAKLLEAEDMAFLDVGKIGLWTRSDACSLFDDLTVSTPIAPEKRP
ncbi:hypothetical protein [Schlesneria paludicola]|uniref:hypothetical protein n=1 Tax=Schlesneria paludicola TaxID=360056 RepID=UPI00058E7EB0|nr:hypothetical protein [Schlesneria paludicola]